MLTRQTRWRPGARVEEVTYPTYVNRNPANTRVQAGLPAPGAPGSPEAASHIDASSRTQDLPAEVHPVSEQEVIENVYED